MARPSHRTRSAKGTLGSTSTQCYSGCAAKGKKGEGGGVRVRRRSAERAETRSRGKKTKRGGGRSTNGGVPTLARTRVHPGPWPWPLSAAMPRVPRPPPRDSRQASPAACRQAHSDSPWAKKGCQKAGARERRVNTIHRRQQTVPRMEPGRERFIQRAVAHLSRISKASSWRWWSFSGRKAPTLTTRFSRRSGASASA